ncbi:hypothetical protein [Rhizobium halophytocola]|uniref:Uncharacterized protein n=1 Tax=Rhizobium halophytocola TaxID=735519 RepID=A0ABS4E3M2_9HYPH|nr:hypothetical protein [Rhizobium halophytocola]MBP1852552.1 hypothetical protein [Rhizobium halophytocola]
MSIEAKTEYLNCAIQHQSPTWPPKARAHDAETVRADRAYRPETPRKIVGAIFIIDEIQI